MAIQRFRPRIVAAHGLQLWLLATAVAATTLATVLMFELVSGMRSVAISEAENSLSAAVNDLDRALREYTWQRGRSAASVVGPASDRELRLLSYEALRPHSLVEGGYLIDDVVVGHSFPEHTEPSSQLFQPDNEREAMLAAAAESRASGDIAHRVFMDSADLVVVSALAPANLGAVSWGLKRFIDFGDPSQAEHRIALAALIAISLASVGGVLLLSLRLQRGFAEMKSGLEQMRGDISFRLPEQNHELRPIAHAVNEMAAAREQVELELRREDQLRIMGRLLAGIAHEIKNPLNSMRIMLQGLKRATATPELIETTADDAIGEIDRLNSMLKNLLAFRGDRPLDMRRQSLDPAIRRCLAVVAPQARERSVRLEYAPDGAPESRFDSDSLQQAILNLLLNAVDAAGDHGVVSLEVVGEPETVAIVVKDSGPGLAREQRDHVFDAFFTTKTNGTGLGLTLTKSLVERMGGSIAYVGAEAGAAFEVRLPRD